MADPELATATGGYYSSTKLKKSSKQSRKPRLQDNVYEQTERTLRQHARPPAVAAIGASINAQPVDGKSLGIASHVVAPPHGARADAGARWQATPNPGWSPDQPRP